MNVDLSQRVSELSSRLEELQAKCTDNPANASEILLDALEGLQESLEELSADEELVRQNEELIRASSALAESEQRYAAIFERSPFAIALTRMPEGITIEVNDAFLRLFKYTREEVIGKTSLDLGISNLDSREQVAAELNKNGSVHDFECIRATKSGEQRILLLNLEWVSIGGERFILTTFKDITDRRKAEGAREQSEAKYSSLFRNSATPAALTKMPEGVFADVNEAFEKLLGYSKKDLIGKNSAEVGIVKIGQRDHPYNEIKEKGSTRHTEKLLYTKSGKVLNVLINVNQITLGSNSYALTTLEDITERKQSEVALQEAKEELDVTAEELRQQNDELIQAHSALQESEARFRSVLDNSVDVIYRLNIQTGRYEYISPSCEEVVGFSPAELMALGAEAGLDMIYPDDRLSMEAAVKRLEETGSAEVEYRQWAKDGSYCWLSNHLSLIKDGDGLPLYRDGNIRDITERKKAEEELRKSESRLKVEQAVEAERRRLFDVLETIPAMVCLLTTDYHVAFANRAFLERFGESQGRPCYEYCFGKNEPCEFCESYRVLETGKPHRWEVASPDGSVIEAHDFPFNDVDGTPMILEMDIDITEHRKTEADLVKAKETAEEAVEAKAAFLANMSHELRTPMNAVIGFSNLLMDETLTPEQKDYIERIKMGGEVLLSLINDILDLSKIEKGKIELEHQPMSLRNLADESLDMVAVQARDKGLNLGLTMQYGTPDTIVGDNGRLRQILVNLLSNAVKFTDAGGVTLSVSSKALRDDTHQILFSVKDTGMGIPESKMELLFQPFSQVEMTISDHRGGTGLGLAISKRLVEMMGGAIWAESEPRIGSVFRFYIEAEVQEKRPCSQKPAVIASDSLAIEKPMRILVAEDNPSNQKVMVETLKRLGYMADVAGDGLEVLQAVERQPYDVIFMDVKMPEMDGIAATREIRKCWPDRAIKIVAITAYALEGDREKCLEAGMDDYIAKPVQKGDLIHALGRVALDPQ